MDLPIRKVTTDMNWPFLGGVDVDRELPFMTREELIPELLKWQSPRSQEQEGYFGVFCYEGRRFEYVSDHCSSCYLLVGVFPDVNR